MPNKVTLEKLIVNLLQNSVCSSYAYHNTEHTLYVTERALEIGKYEACSEKEMNLLMVASLLHDLGYINIYNGHEEEGCKLAMLYLPEYGFLTDDIYIICGMIMATKYPQNPKTKLEEILADADLEYLGTESAGSKAEDLFKELQLLNPSLTKQEWNNQQISFIQKHEYFTAYCKENREPVKATYLKTLLNPY